MPDQRAAPWRCALCPSDCARAAECVKETTGYVKYERTPDGMVTTFVAASRPDDSRATIPRDPDPSASACLGPDSAVCEACNQPAIHTLPRRPTINDDYTINVGPCCDPDLHESCEHIT